MTLASPAMDKPRGRIRTDGVITQIPQMPVGRSAPQSAFMHGERSTTFRGWHPALRETSDDVRASWRIGTARAVDAMQNSGWLTGAVDTSCGTVVGTGLTLSAKPNMSFLGWNEDQTSEWARQIERRFELWANNPRACDARAIFSLGQMGAQAYRHWLATGEIVATLPYFAHAGSTFKTKIKLLPAWRLSDRSDLSVGLYQGVRINAVGAPVGYLFRVRWPYQDVGIGTGEIEVAATDSLGRPLTIHVFDGEPEQHRGITPFISILKVIRQFDQLADATLTAAIVQAIFAAVFKSGAATDEVMGAMQSESEQSKEFENLLRAKGGWYDRADISLGVNGKIAHLFPGDELQFMRSEHPNSTYESFSNVLLRECSRPLAMSHEEFSGDWRGATYSSTRMANAANWPRVLYRRKHIVGRFHQIAYEAWLEEDIESGATPLPGGIETYLANKDSIARADWRGPPKPQADDTKASNSHETWSRLGVMSDEMICADLGTDTDDVYETRAREKRRRQQLGLPEPNYARAVAATAEDQTGNPAQPGQPAESGQPAGK